MFITCVSLKLYKSWLQIAVSFSALTQRDHVTIIDHVAATIERVVDSFILAFIKSAVYPHLISVKSEPFVVTVASKYEDVLLI